MRRSFPIDNSAWLLLAGAIAVNCGSSDSATPGGGTSTGGGGAAGGGTSGASGKGGASAGTGGTSAGSSGSSAAGAAGAGGGAATGGSAGSGGASGASAGSGGSAGVSGSGGASGFGTATPIAYGTPIKNATLDPLATDVDIYRFEGKKGDRIVITANHVGKYPYADLVVQLFDSKQTRIAQANDSVRGNDADSWLGTVLPADGTYYIEVEGCVHWDTGGKASCLPIMPTSTNGYAIALDLRTGVEPSVAFEKEPDDDAATGTPFTFAKVAGKYPSGELWGDFSAGTDVDVFTFTVPADTPLPALGSRPVGYFWWVPGGPGETITPGNGSTTQLDIAIVDPADPTRVVARISDGAGATELSPPLLPGKLYNLVAKRGAVTGTNDFYVVQAAAGGGYAVELETSGQKNDTVATAEPVTKPPMQPLELDFIEGDLTPASADVDCFSIPVPGPSFSKIDVYCQAATIGSGLQGLKVEILTTDGTTLPGAVATETATSSVAIVGVAVPSGSSKLALRISAASQDPGISGAFYRCVAGMM